MADAAQLVLLATGATLVILLGGIDLSGAALASLSSVLLAEWLNDLRWLGLIIVIVVATAAGATQGAIQGVAQTPPFVVTLGGLGVFSGVALRVSGERTRTLGDGASVVDWMNGSLVWFVPNAFIVALVVAGLVAVLLHRTRRGRNIYLTGLAETAATMSRVRPVHVRITAFALAGTCAGLAGIVMTARTGFGSPTLSNGLPLPTIAAVVAGGTAISGGVGGVLRTVLGALIIFIIRAGSVIWGVEPVYQDIVFGVLVIAAVAATTDRSKLDTIK